MQTKNKDSVTIHAEAHEIRETAKAEIEKRIQEIKKNLQSEHHGNLESEILETLKRHKENGENLKGPSGLAAQAKQQTEHLSKMGNQKNILKFLKLHAAHDKLEERLNKSAQTVAIAMAAKRVQDLMA